jgi:hypothetical protein
MWEKNPVMETRAKKKHLSKIMTRFEDHKLEGIFLVFYLKFK